MAQLMSAYGASKKELLREWSLPQWFLFFDRAVWLRTGKMPVRGTTESATEIKARVKKAREARGK
jgi:hypothetical protein